MRRIDTDLKRVYLSTGAACMPALALATLSKTMAVWADNVDDTLRGFSEDAAKNAPIQELKLASAFLGEASIDIFHLLVRGCCSLLQQSILWLCP